MSANTIAGSRIGSAADEAGSSGERFLQRFVLKNKRPITGDHRLTIRNVFVLPSRAGLLFSTVLLAMLICSINYGLALGYALSFLIFGVAVVGMMHTFRNISSLTLRHGRSEPVFAGQIAEVSFMIVNRSKLERYALRADAPQMTQTETIDVPGRSEQIVRIALPTHERGWMPMPQITMSTRFPLGIWRAWAYWMPAQHVLVYPAPESPAPSLPLSTLDAGDGHGHGGREEDLAGIRPFQAGDSPRRIAWTAMARTGTDEILSKHFEGGATGELLLDYTQLPGTLNTEERLSRLTRWVLDAEAIGTRYALELPGVNLEAGSGTAHKIKCLEALALYGMNEKQARAK